MAGIPWVLLVDDEPEIRHDIGELIRSAGFRVSSARDGEEALVLFAEVRPSIVITDLRMPRLDGPGLIGRLRSSPRNDNVPILVLTGDTRREVKISLLQLGADDFIHKPIDGSELVARLDALARRSRMMRLIADNGPKLMRSSPDGGDPDLERLAWRLVAAVERSSGLSDDETSHHIRRVTELAAMLCRLCGMDPRDVEDVRRFAGLHDVGKIGLPDALLRDRGLLDELQLEQMRTHTVIGADLLRSAGLPRLAVDIALHHHERWDGHGYPHGLKGDAIPAAARAVAVVDTLDGLTTQRPWRDGLAFEEALLHLQTLAGTQLDPVLVDIVSEHATEVARIREQFAAAPQTRGEWA